MGKTLEQYLAGLTGEQMRAMTLKWWSEAGGTDGGGAEQIEKWRAGRARSRYEDVVAKAAAHSVVKSPLVGNVVRTIRLQPYAARSIVEAIQSGKYSNNTAEIARQFAKERVGLREPTSIDLVQFDRDPSEEEMVEWDKANRRKPIMAKYLLAIGIQHPKLQQEALIVARGSVQGGFVLFLDGYSGWRCLSRRTVAGGWNRGCLFGYLSKSNQP